MTIDLRINQFEKELELNAKQLRLLRIAKKGAISSFAQELTELATKAEQSDNFTETMSFYEYAYRSPREICAEQPIWQKALRKVFNEHQQEFFDEFKKEQQADFRKLAMAFTLFSSEQEVLIPTSLSELNKLKKLFEDELADDCPSTIRGIFTLYMIDEDKVEKAYSKQKWETVRETYAEMREMGEALMAADQETDDD